MMNDEQLARYARNILVKDFDVEGQDQLLAKRALIVGAGGLACPVALYLAAAGVGRITVVDHDFVDVSNLQRQIAHGETDVNQPKVTSLKASMEAINSSVEVNAVAQKADQALLERLLPEVDVVLDCTDNFTTRFLINELSFKYKVPLVSGAAIRAEGQLGVFNFNEQSPCYRCLYTDEQEVAESCSETGIIGAVVGVLGSMQAMEAIKILSGFGKPLDGVLSVFDFKQGQWRQLKLHKDPACPSCSEQK